MSGVVVRVRAYGNCSTGTGHSDGPDLTRPPVSTVPPPRAPVRGGIATDDYATGFMKHLAKRNAARARLKTAGKTWTQAREWALTQGTWTVADLPRAPINTVVVDAYLNHLKQTSTA